MPTSMLALQSLIGIIVIPLIAWLLSENRRALGGAKTLRIVGAGLALQIAIGMAMLGLPGISELFGLLSRGVAALQAAMDAGVRMAFGYLGGGPAPFEIKNPERGFILAFRALPLILIMSVLSRLLYHWGILQLLVRGFAWGLRRTLGVGGALGTATAANIFVGMVEAPLLIRPYLRDMGRGALFATMTAGMATVAGTVMALYASILEPVLPGATGHILAASVMSAPAALMIARLMVPGGYSGETAEDAAIPIIEEPPESTMDAVAQGTAEGLKLLAYVVATLVVMVALVALVNSILGLAPEFSGAPLSLERVLGWLCMPLAWLIGIPWAEAGRAGELIGIKIILNEFLAYLKLAQIPEPDLSARSRLIMTYALCGFANLGSLGIMTGGLIAMVPERRAEIAMLGPKTILSGTLAVMLTGATIGLLSP